jgi:hypothetical protein
MPSEILTEVSAAVSSDRVPELLDGFHRLLSEPMPAGLVRTELLRGEDDSWRIQTLWRDMDALDAMRTGPTPPAAPQLFREVGAEPTLRILSLQARGGTQR